VRNLALALVGALATAGCLAPPPRTAAVDPAIMGQVDAATERRPVPRPQAVEQAMLPPLRMELPSARGKPIEPKFDLAVSNAPAAQVFMSIVSGTRYSMLVHPQIAGTISVNLKDVSVAEALDAIREIYGYDYRIEGSRIYVQPAGIQTRVFRVNYLQTQRRGASDLRVQSGSVSDSGVPGAPPLAASPAVPVPGTLAGGQVPATRSLESTRISTRLVSDFWEDLRSALGAIVGSGEGRNVVVSPQSGVVVVRAMPQELRAVEQYLRETRLAVERQVMLEAKVISVSLLDAYQSGINWAAFRNSGPSAVIGQSSNAAGSTQLTTRGSPGALIGGGQSIDTAERAIVTAGSAALAAANPASAVFGLALQTSNFAALLQFLESQGSVQVLSSPRVATLNNQKAVLKVGTDEFFVTNVATVTTTSATGTQQTPTVTVAPFFSGILLDVTPQIDENDNITLHVHPSISEVTESRRVVDLGGTVPSITLPLAKSTVSETDTVVRVTDGNIVAIGGLMSVDLRDNRGGIPGASEAAALLRNTSKQLTKRELVILIKPTVVRDDRNWEQEVRDTRERLQNLYPPQPAAGGQPR
jgi:MSHA biogenesis protein MshL